MSDGKRYSLDSTAVGKLATMYRDSQRDTNSPAAQRIPRASSEEARYFYGTIQTTGPAGTEADYTDARYWIKRQWVSNSSTTATDAVTLADATSPYNQIITATNLAEIGASTHNLKSGTKVQVWWEYDLTTPTPTIRYVIGQPAAGGIIPLNLERTGGTDGGWSVGSESFTFPTYTYTALNAMNSATMGTGLSPVMRLFPGSCAAAANGIGYVGPTGTFILLFTDEKPNVDPCDNYDGSTGTGTLGAMPTSLSFAGMDNVIAPTGSFAPNDQKSASILNSIGGT